MTANTATTPPKTARAETQCCRVRLQVASMGLGRGQEHRQRGTGDQRGGPRHLGDVLVDPEPAQDQAEDQFGDEEGLDDRELPAVECDRLEGKSTCRRHPTEEPERLAKEETDEIPATVFVGHTDTGRVLGHEVDRIGQRRSQGEDDRDGHVTTPDRVLLR